MQRHSSEKPSPRVSHAGDGVVTISKLQGILFGVVALAIAIVFFVAGRGCAPRPIPAPLDPGGVDAGPGEEIIAEQLDGAVHAGQVQIEQIEHKFEADMAAFDEQQRAHYEQLRHDDLEEAAEFLSQWARAHHHDAGTRT